jgi:hypothetical protein
MGYQHQDRTIERQLLDKPLGVPTLGSILSSKYPNIRLPSENEHLGEIPVSKLKKT